MPLMSSLRKRSNALTREDLGEFDGGLVEGVHAHEPRRENRFEHKMHHECADAALVEVGKVDGPAHQTIDAGFG